MTCMGHHLLHVGTVAWERITMKEAAGVELMNAFVGE